ncbi:BTB/POZ domain-containing protein [Rhizophagus clarus]|uniref:BTB/POZ domain-containing protein n=1 Tax=Rhizophagus clarus TaxID=94130 RepID=A0A8H3LG58_9GLOM|nr:BTB/POZ domain-containing protein [Rhizophagus clarus]
MIAMERTVLYISLYDDEIDDHTVLLGKLQKINKIRKTDKTNKVNELDKIKTSNDVIIYAGEEPNIKEFLLDSKTLQNQILLLKPSKLLIITFLFLRSDPIETLQAVYSYNILNDVQMSCLETICYEPEVLFKSPKFINLPASILEIIIKRDDLALDEIEIWDNLIRWGLAQEKNLNKSVSKWNQEEFAIFEKILHKFISSIRFYEISSEDYFNKVRPYEEILSEELRDEILKYYMIPKYEPTLNKHLPRYSRYNDSVLINKKHLVNFTRKMRKLVIVMVIRNYATTGPGFGSGSDLVCRQGGAGSALQILILKLMVFQLGTLM